MNPSKGGEMSPSKGKNKDQLMQDLSLRSFDQSLPMTLLRAREAVMKKFIPSLQEHGLSPQQWRTIRALVQQDGLQISELSNRCHLLLPSMSRIIQNLEARNIVERRNVADDQRRKAIYLSQQGHELFALIAPKSAERYGFITEQFGEQKLQQLYDLLHELVSSIDEEKNED